MKQERRIKMIDIKNMDYSPHLSELSSYVSNPLFDDIIEYLINTYQTTPSIEYSKDSLLKGWNIKFRKLGKSLCVIYPKVGYFTVLVVVGKKEKEKVEATLHNLSCNMQNIYRDTKEGMEQRWLMIDLHLQDDLYHDVLKLILIRMNSRNF